MSDASITSTLAWAMGSFPSIENQVSGISNQCIVDTSVKKIRHIYSKKQRRRWHDKTLEILNKFTNIF